MKKITVRRQEGKKTFGVFYGEQLIEGGFFERQHAVDTALDLREDWARGVVRAFVFKPILSNAKHS
jgi:hypothetical protein